jgi:hypothetical protein
LQPRKTHQPYSASNKKLCGGRGCMSNAKARNRERSLKIRFRKAPSLALEESAVSPRRRKPRRQKAHPMRKVFLRQKHLGAEDEATF